MPDPLSFPTSSSRHSLPLLFAGQSQKEFFVNEALTKTDILLHPVVEGETNDPPASPAEGECWIAGALPTGAWDGFAEHLCCFQSGQWICVGPREGLRVFDKFAGFERVYDQGWQDPPSVALPSGGSVIDVEARDAIAGLISALVGAGVIQQS